MDILANALQVHVGRAIGEKREFLAVKLAESHAEERLLFEHLPRHVGEDLSPLGRIPRFFDRLLTFEAEDTIGLNDSNSHQPDDQQREHGAA